MILQSKLIITNINDKLCTVLMKDRTPDFIEVKNLNEDTVLNSIYVGKVQDIVGNINAAFIEYSQGLKGYFPMNEWGGDKPLRTGDEVLVQVVKSDMKTKYPVVTTNISISGKYAILTVGKSRIGYSSKINSKRFKLRMNEALKDYINDEYGLIIRTNAFDSDSVDVLNEIKYLIELWKDIREKAKYRTCFSLMYKPLPEYILNIRDMYSSEYEEIVTDIPKYYNEIKEYLVSRQPNDVLKLRMYEDNMLTLAKFYSLKERITELLNERVWLKSGAYLVIQPTEALIVIDVNSGKFTSKKNKRDTFLRVNLEAAVEAARQIKLRNYSGIIIIDFIDMEYEEDKLKLMEELEYVLKKDHIKTTLVEMTKLNLVEITRKKIKKPLHELISISDLNAKSV